MKVPIFRCILFCCNRTSAEAHPWIFHPQNFVDPTLSLQTEGIFQGSFQSESSEGPDQASTEGTRWELAVDLSLRHGFGHGFPRKRARILFRKLAWISSGFFEPFFPCPKQIHATQNPQIHAVFGNFSPNGFSGCSTQFASLVLYASIFYVDQPRLVC